MLVPPESLKSDPASENEDEDVLVALGSVASFTGEQAGALLIIIQSLTRHRLISMADASKLVTLLSAESPDAERRVRAQCTSRRKARPIRACCIVVRRAASPMASLNRWRGMLRTQSAGALPRLAEAGSNEWSTPTTISTKRLGSQMTERLTSCAQSATTARPSMISCGCARSPPNARRCTACGAQVWSGPGRRPSKAFRPWQCRRSLPSGRAVVHRTWSAAIRVV